MAQYPNFDHAGCEFSVSEMVAQVVKSARKVPAVMSGVFGSAEVLSGGTFRVYVQGVRQPFHVKQLTSGTWSVGHLYAETFDSDLEEAVRVTIAHA